ncbi:hypothetical protein X805_15100 [Sphaerotilus natans subsp. natans DSM 6575]|uniref:Uncharacterized protein n=1 Tax=Sphaerotilus natans subsp. natans DSM 6575 TaxID=1286631 RepID=A0A059KN68_9BURK|nr:hypothetical protein [Sphaerotilus natans]KDB52906.1 hypothetical protein X805_15100 [Sphaerotilus natans subsp. natans DSM 6575]SIS05176.1 hypothetical protein SAMN05421778_13213 [Sphaerotilus natans]
MKKGSAFIYPCAGSDVVGPIEHFGQQMETFVFVDIRYQFSRFEVRKPAGWHEDPDSVLIEGPLRSGISPVFLDGQRHYRHIKPAWRHSQYVHAATGRTIDVVFRRGFGQYALHEMPDESLGVFFHRGDSLGEGGSGVFFLANRHKHHAPLSNLLDVIKRKVAYPALIVSDGSNTSIRALQAAGHGDTSVQVFFRHGLRWERVRTLNRGSVVWRVELSPADDPPP